MHPIFKKRRNWRLISIKTKITLKLKNNNAGTKLETDDKRLFEYINNYLWARKSLWTRQTEHSNIVNNLCENISTFDSLCAIEMFPILHQYLSCLHYLKMMTIACYSYVEWAEPLNQSGYVAGEQLDLLWCHSVSMISYRIKSVHSLEKTVGKFRYRICSHFDGWLLSLLLPNIIRMWVSRAKWSLFSMLCAEKMALGVSNWSSKFGPVSLPGEIGGVAYNGDMQPISDRSKIG